MNDVNNKNNGQPGQDNNPNGGKGGPNRKRNFIMLGISLAIFFFLMWSSTSMLSNSSHEEITYSQFVEMVDAGEVEEVIIEEEILYITPKVEEEKPQSYMDVLMQYYGGGSPEKVYITAMMEDYSALSARLIAADVTFDRTMPSSTGSVIYLLLTSVLPLVLMVAFFGMMMKRMSGKGGMFGMGKSTAKVYVQKETGVTFKDVAGEDEAKESLVEVY